MKWTFAAILAVLVCLVALGAGSLRAAAPLPPEAACAEQERLALEAIDAHLRDKLQRLSKR